MQLSDIITVIGEELDRSDIDTQIKRWVQQSIDHIVSILPTKSLERSSSLTSTASQETLALPGDFGEIIELRYTPGDESGYKLTEMTPSQFFEKYPDQDSTGYPTHFCLYKDEIHLGILPSGSYSFTLRYRVASPSIYHHDINLTHDANAAVSGVQIYVDEDAVGTGEGKLYFVSPTSSDCVIATASANAHAHELTIYHNDNAATLGVPWYFDEDGTDKNLFVSPTSVNCIAKSGAYRRHTHYAKFTHYADAAADGVAVYCDEDVADKTKRLLFVSPTASDGTVSTVFNEADTLPLFIEQYHEAVILFALGRGYRWLRDWDAMRSAYQDASSLLSAINSSERRKTDQVVASKPFSTEDSSWRRSLQFNEIDD